MEFSFSFSLQRQRLPVYDNFYEYWREIFRHRRLLVELNSIMFLYAENEAYSIWTHLNCVVKAFNELFAELW